MLSTIAAANAAFGKIVSNCSTSIYIWNSHSVTRIYLFTKMNILVSAISSLPGSDS